MNCRPGDLAVVVRLNRDSDDLQGGVARFVLGHVVKVTRLLPGRYAFWAIEKPIPIAGATWTEGGVRMFATAGLVTALPDEILQPIRGVPERDEVTEDLKAPA